MRISNQSADTVGQLPQRPSDKEFGRLAVIFRSLAAGFSSYGAVLQSFSPDPSNEAKVASNLARARALTEDPSSVWLEMTEVYRVDDKPAGWAVLRSLEQAPARPPLADILAKETGWSDNTAAKVAAVAERAGGVGLSISTLDRSPEWKAKTCRLVRAALMEISAARTAYADWIGRNIGTSERTQQLVHAVDELENEIAKLKKWEAIFRQQEVERRRPH